MKYQEDANCLCCLCCKRCCNKRVVTTYNFNNNENTNISISQNQEKQTNINSLSFFQTLKRIFDKSNK